MLGGLAWYDDPQDKAVTFATLCVDCDHVELTVNPACNCGCHIIEGKMQEQKYNELEERVTRLSEDAIPEGMTNAMFRKLEQRQRIHQEIEAMRAEGKAYTLTEEEIAMIESFRRFKLRMRKDGEVFTFQTRKPEGVLLVAETAEIIHPSETR
jgi:hypothetical protein